jgi:hypothetical protein
MPEANYRGVQIVVRFKQAQQAGWGADFMLVDKMGCSDEHFGSSSFSDSDSAYRDALNRAQQIIDTREGSEAPVKAVVSLERNV